MADELGVENVVTLLQARAAVRGYAGDPRCVDDLRAACDLGLRLGLGRDTAISMNNLADSESFYIGLGQARETLEQAMAFSSERGLAAGVMWQRGERLRHLYHGGEWDAALVEAAEVLAWDLETRAGPLSVFARLPLAGIGLHRGDLEVAREQAAALMAGAERSGDPQVLVPGLSMAALVASAAGDVDAAVLKLEQLELVTRDQPAWRTFCRVEPLRVAVSLGRPDLGEAFLGDPGSGAGWDPCSYATAHAVLTELRGDVVGAARWYREAAGRWSEWGSVVEQAYALLGLGRCGDRDAAREADAIFAGLGARPVLARAA